MRIGTGSAEDFFAALHSIRQSSGAEKGYGVCLPHLRQMKSAGFANPAGAAGGRHTLAFFRIRNLFLELAYSPRFNYGLASRYP